MATVNSPGGVSYFIHLYFKKCTLRNTNPLLSVAFFVRFGLASTNEQRNTPSLSVVPSYSFSVLSIATYRQKLHHGKYPYGIAAFSCLVHKLIFHYSVSAGLCRSPSRIIRWASCFPASARLRGGQVLYSSSTRQIWWRAERWLIFCQKRRYLQKRPPCIVS